MERRSVYISLLPVCYVLFMVLCVGPTAPMDGGDDYNHVAVAAWLPWERVLSSFLTGATSSQKFYGDGVTDHALTSRVGQTLLIKLIHQFSGPSVLPYFLAQFLFGALSSWLLARLALRFTGSVRWALFAGSYYFFLPSAFLHNIWLSDAAEVVHVLTLIAFSALLAWKDRLEDMLLPASCLELRYAKQPLTL